MYDVYVDYPDGMSLKSLQETDLTGVLNRALWHAKNHLGDIVMYRAWDPERGFRLGFFVILGEVRIWEDATFPEIFFGW